MNSRRLMGFFPEPRTTPTYPELTVFPIISGAIFVLIVGPLGHPQRDTEHIEG
jgi:hypothetical protein